MDPTGGMPNLRPFYVVVVVWGEKYRNFFLEYALPSMLAPGNIPALAGSRPVKYLIATTAQDWAVICDTAIIRTLERYAIPVFVELPPHPPERPYWMQNILGQKICCDIAKNDNAYRIFTSPDGIYSDGMVLRLHELAIAGASAVLKLVSPLTRTSLVFNTFAELGFLRSDKSARDTGEPMSFSGRQLAAVAIKAMHSLSAVNEWNSPHFCGYASTPWWAVPGSEGMVMCGLRWDVLLLDYAAAPHDGSILDARGFDGDYPMRTIGDLETIYLVRDSDEFHVLSWASLPDPELPPHRYGDFGKRVAFRASAHGPEFNGMQRDLLFCPTLVHTGDLGKKWDAVEAKALRAMLTWVDPPGDIERYSRKLPSELQTFAGLQARIVACRLPWWRRNATAWRLIRRFVVPLVDGTADWTFLPMARLRAILSVASVFIRRAALALRGDAAAIQWWSWGFRKLLARILRRPFNEPRPGR